MENQQVVFERMISEIENARSNPNRCHYLKNKLKSKLIQAIYQGYYNPLLVKEVCYLCNVTELTWNQYVYSYSLFKKYEQESLVMEEVLS